MDAKRDCAPEGDHGVLTQVNFGRSSRRIALRDARIVASRARGKGWAEIALEHKLSVRRCQQVVAQWREDGLGGDQTIDPMREARAMLDLLEQAVVDCAALEERTRHDGVKIAATRQKLEAAFARFELLQLLGLIPRPQVISVEREMQQLFREMAALAEDFDLPREYMEAVLALSERRLGPQPVGVLEAAA